MNNKISLVINADTRPGWLEDFTGIKDYGDNSLCGCRSVDFMLDGVRNKIKFLDGCDLETILFIDEHEPIPEAVMYELEAMVSCGQISKLIIERIDHSVHRWNDRLYCQTLAHATYDYVAHFDGDSAAFRRPEYPFVEKCIKWLDEGYKFVCQQTPMTEAEHGMWWCSTRFLFCKLETLDLAEIIRCLNDKYRVSKHGNTHCPCFEHIASLITGKKVLYPPCDNENFAVINWVHYYRGVLARLNLMPYEEVAEFIFKTCGGPLGASDLICQKLP